VEVDPAEVGSAEAVQTLRDLQAEAPSSLQPDIETVVGYMESGAIDYEADPSSVDLENFPAEVQAALESVRSFASDAC